MTTGNRSFGGFAYTTAKWGNGKVQILVGQKTDKSWSGGNGKAPTNSRYRVRATTAVTQAYLEPQAFEMTKTIEQRGLFRCKALPDWVSSAGGGDGILETTATGHTTQEPLVSAQDRLALVEKIRKQAFGSGFNPLVFTAEGREALDMIGNAATRVGAALHGLRTLNWKLLVRSLERVPERHAKRVLQKLGRKAYHRRDFSGAWLELQYGWLPLLSDMEEGAHFIAHAMTEKRPTKSFRGRRVIRKTEIRRSWGPEWAGYAKTDWVTKLQVVVYVDPSKPVNATLNLWDLSEVVWERTPWSFAVDWVVPVGSYLSGLNTASKVKGKTVYTYFITGVSEDVIPNPNRCEKIGFNSYLTNRYETVHVMREVYADLGTFVRPPLELDSNALQPWRRAANAVALLSQMNFSKLADLFTRGR